MFALAAAALFFLIVFAYAHGVVRGLQMHREEQIRLRNVEAKAAINSKRIDNHQRRLLVIDPPARRVLRTLNRSPRPIDLDPEATRN